MTDYKILSLTNDLIDSYSSPIQRIDGLIRNPKEIIRTVEFYSLDQFLGGNKDSLGREKPFINQGNSRVRVAKTATDIDVKDIKFEPDYLTYSTEAMIYNHELYKYLKESNFSLTLNEMGLTRPKYGGVLVKRYDDGEGLEIEVVDWVNVDFDPANILGSPIIEHHWIYPSDLLKKSDIWSGYDDIGEVIKAHAKANKNKPAKIEILEVTGEFSFSFDPNEGETEKNDIKFKKMCFYIACVNKKKYLLYKEDLKNEEDKYKYLPWEKIGDGLGRGVWEEGFEAQVWSNDQYIQMKNVMDLAGKSLITTTSKKMSGNAIVGVDNGHIFEVEQGSQTNVLNLSPNTLPVFQNMINQFAQEYNRISSTFDANTGEQPPSGTPLGQTQILNQVANSPFQYQQEVWGIWLNEILNDWILPDLKKRILKDHTLVSDFTDEELDLIDADIINEHVNPQIIDQMIQGTATPEGADMLRTNAKQDLMKNFGKKRELKIPEKYLDIKGKITANITGELKNKGAILQSLDSVFKTVISSFNPNTGKYAVLEDPILKKVFGQIVEMSGIPFSSTQLSTNQSSQPMSTVGSQPTSMTAQATTVPQMA